MFGLDFGLLCLKNNNIRRRVLKGRIKDVFPAVNMRKTCKRDPDRQMCGYIYTFVSKLYFLYHNAKHVTPIIYKYYEP
jgi:hypothetical protein